MESRERDSSSAIPAFSSTTSPTTLAETMSAELDALPRSYFDPGFDAVGYELSLLLPSSSPEEEDEEAENMNKRNENLVPSFDVLEALAAKRTLALEAASDRLRAALKRGSSAAALEGIEGVVSVAGELGSAARAASRARGLLLPASKAAALARAMALERARAARLRETAELVTKLAEASRLVRAAQAHAEDWGAGAGAAFESARRAREALRPSLLLSPLSSSSSSSSSVVVVVVARSLAAAADRALADASARLEGTVAALTTSGGGGGGSGGSDSSSSAFEAAARAVVAGFAARGGAGGEEEGSSLSSSLLSAFTSAPSIAALKVLRGAALTGASSRGGAAASAASVAKTLPLAAAAVPREGASRALSSVLMVFFDVLASQHALTKFLGKWGKGEGKEGEEHGTASASLAAAAAAAAEAVSSKAARMGTWASVSRCVCEILVALSKGGGNLEPGVLLSWCGALEKAGRAFVESGDGASEEEEKEEEASSSFSALRLAAERAAASALASQASFRSTALQSMLDAESWSLLSVEERDVPEVRRFHQSSEEEEEEEKRPLVGFDRVLSEGNPWRPSSSASPSSSSSLQQKKQQQKQLQRGDEEEEEEKTRSDGRRRRLSFTASTFKVLQWSSEFFAAAATASPSSSDLLSAAAREASLRLFETVLVHFVASFGPCSLAAAVAAAPQFSPLSSSPPPITSVASFCAPVPPRLRSALARALFISQPELAAAHGVVRKGGGGGGVSGGGEYGSGKKTIAVAVGPPRPSTAALANHLVPGTQTQSSAVATQPTPRSNAGNLFALRERLAASAALRELARRLRPSLLPEERGNGGGASSSSSAASSSLAAAEDAAALAVSVAACLNLPLIPLRDAVAATAYARMGEPPAEAARWVGTAAAAARALSERLADAAESSSFSSSAAADLSRVWREALRCLFRCVVDGLAAAGDVENSSASSFSSSSSSAGAGAERGNGGAAAAAPPPGSLSPLAFSPMGRSAMSGDSAALRPLLVASGAAIERALLLSSQRRGGAGGGGGNFGGGDDAGALAAAATAAAAEACDACFSRTVDGFIRAYYLPFAGSELRGWARGALFGLPAAAAAAGSGGEEAEEEEEEDEEEFSSSSSYSLAQVAALLRCVAAAQGFPQAAVEAEMREIIAGR